MPKDDPPPEIVLYRTEDQRTRLEVRLTGGTVWLTQAQMAELFQTTPQNITQHLRAIYADLELVSEATCKDYLQVRREGARNVRRPLKHYNLDFAELQAHSRRPMTMRDWIAKLDDFLRLSERDVLTHAGRVSHEQAVAKAAAEFERHRLTTAAEQSAVDRDFDQAISEVKRIESAARRRAPRRRRRPPSS